MTFHQLRCVIDVGRTGSISRSAVNLYMSQPNLSGIITQLEKELGITLFTRTNKGVLLTEDGLEFMAYAQKIITDFDHLERKYRDKKNNAVSFSVAWTMSAAVSEQICRYLNRIEKGVPVNIKLIETNQLDVVSAVSRNHADGGKVVIPETYLDLYERYCEAQGLVFHKLWKIKSCLLFSAESKLAAADVIEKDMFTDDLIEVQYSLNGLYDLPNTTQTRQRAREFSTRKIYFNDRGNLLDILTLCPNTYVHAIPISPASLKRYNLVMRHYPEPLFTAVEALIYPKRPLSKEAQLLVNGMEQLKDPRHPCWAPGFGPEPLQET